MGTFVIVFLICSFYLVNNSENHFVTTKDTNNAIIPKDKNKLIDLLRKENSEKNIGKPKQEEWKNRAFIFHSPHGSGDDKREEFQRIARDYLKKSGPDKPITISNITFVTYTNRPSDDLVKKFYKFWNLTSVTLSTNVKKWTWMEKIAPLYNWLQSGNCKTEYIIATDANDCAFYFDKIEDYYDGKIIDLFKSYDTEILFGNSWASWPPNDELKIFEEKKYLPSQFHNHPSAGYYMGRASYIKDILKEIIEGDKEKATWTLHGGWFDDAASWRYMHKKYYPKMKVDNKCKIFSRWDIYFDKW